jgi:hypothetical protein
MMKSRHLRTPSSAPDPARDTAAAAARLLGAPPASPRGRVLIEDLDLRIDVDGQWYYHGSMIRRKELICLFSSALTRDTDGGYWLVTPAEMGRIQVDDAPFLAVEAFNGGAGREQVISLRTNVDEIVTVDEAHAIHVVSQPASGEPRPYVELHRGLNARLTRSAFYDVVEMGCEEGDGEERTYGVWSSGRFFPLGNLDEGT